MTILVDVSKGSSDLHGLLPRGGSILTDLYLTGSNNRADAAWFGNGPTPRGTYVGVERKRLGDALACMQDGRLVEQLRGLVRTYDLVWIVIEDEIRPAPKTGILERLVHDRSKNPARHYQCNSKCRWFPAFFGHKRKLMWSDFRHWLGTIVHKGTEESGIVIRHEFTRNARETADTLWTEYTWWQKSWGEHKSLNVFDSSHERPKKGMLLRPPIEAYIAKQFDGFGWDRALAACDVFPSPRALANGTVEEWERVEGVGRKLAESMVRQWGRERVVRDVRVEQKAGGR